MTLLLVFIDQVCPSYKDFFKENIIIIYTVMTVLSLFFFVKFGLALIRIVTSMLILAILMASSAFLLSDATPETRSAIFIVIEIVTAVFFLLWNFWSKGKKQENDEAV
jgi:4-hydroxybenzoate polyprenyltransferase